jgi:hypothetical protein
MATLRYVCNGQVIFPELPIEREDLIIENARRMVNAQLRVAHVATKKRLRFFRGDLSESEAATWLLALPIGQSISVTDEQLVTRTMRVRSRTDPLDRTTPLVEGSTNTTGGAFYTITAELEEI